MDFITLKDKFVNENPDYYNDILNYINYFQNERHYKLPEQQEYYAEGIRAKNIIESLKHYVDLGKIRKQEPAKKYFVAIGQLYEFALSNSQYTNTDLLSELRLPLGDPNSYKAQTAAFIEQSSLLPKEAKPMLTEKEVLELINWCDERIAEDINKATDNRTSFKRVSACLCIKLMLLTGVSYGVTRKILLDDLDIDRAVITISDLPLRLPPRRLTIQFKEYYSVKIAMTQKSKPYLFSDYSGRQWGEATTSSGIPDYLDTAIDRTDTTGITKYGIGNLIKNDINSDIITKLTGFSKEIINSCIEEITEKDNDSIGQKLNAKISNSKIYYLL